MTRIVELKETKPLIIDPSKEKVWVCRCGLSKDWPYCDGSHKLARQEHPGKRYAYHRTPEGELVREEVELDVDADPRP